MPRFAANLSMLFTEHDFLDRFDAAATAGFKGVEYICSRTIIRPTDVAGRGLKQERPDAGAAQPARRRLGQGRARHRLPAGSRALNSARASPRRSTTRRRSAASRSTAWPASRQRASTAAVLEDVFAENLRFAAEEAGAGRHQAADRADQHAATFRASSSTHPDQALALIDERRRRTTCSCNTTSITCSVMEGELARTIEANLGRIAHIQLADNPGRNEPGTGEINYPFLFTSTSIASAIPAGSARIQAARRRHRGRPGLAARALSQ